ncbi:LuxR C-terminal-related transcriptional regulator [Pseudonocardia sp. CA-107938]|uniref:LuxR C-terminal-related transcriptional regulator n=1 Tax=Pseudonocardia sp. CA-107938 TaxID=3240021 RepID=UPI003D905209
MDGVVEDPTPHRRLSRMVAAKLHPPVSAAALLHRADVLREMHRTTATRKVTVLSAPAGSGKTTAAAQWARTSPDPVGWLSLDPDDDDPHRFVALAAGAVAAADPALAAAFDERDETVAERLNRLFSVLDDQPRVGLVLDDYHVLGEVSTHRAAAELVERSPTSLRVLLVTRRRPPLPLSTWRIRHLLGELDPALLTLHVTETDALLRMAGIELDDRLVAALHTGCEGWFAATVLAVAALADRPDPGRLAGAFVRHGHLVDDYLLDEVLAAHGPAARRLLAELSVVERFTGGLATAVTGRRDAPEEIERLFRANALIVATDDGDARWYRYHHLLRRLLTARLETWSETPAEELHARAAGWFARSGFADEAIDHTIAARDWARAVALLSERPLERLDPTDLRRFLDWVDALPPSARTPQLVQTAIDANFWHSDRFLGDRPATRPRRKADPRNPSLSDLVVDLIQVSHDGDVTGAVAVGRAMSQAATDPVTRAAGVVSELVGILFSGQPGLEEVLARAEAFAEFPELVASTATVRAWRAWHDGDVAETRRQLDRVLAHDELLDGPVAGHALALHSRLLAEDGRLAEAETIARRLAARSVELGLPGHQALALAQVAHTLVTAGRTAEAAEPARLAAAALHRCHDPGPVQTAWVAAACAAAGLPLDGPTEPTDPLSTREREFLELLATDLSLADIAKRLFVSVNTAKTHRRAVYAKLGVADRQAAVDRGARLGLL